MPDAVDENDKCMRRRWLRIPSFRIAWMLSAFALLALIAWVFVDASLPAAVDTSLMLTRIKPNPGSDVSSRLALDQLGGRAALLAVVALLTVASNAVVVARLFIGRAGGRSVLAYLAATALVGGWLAFFVGYGDLKWRGWTFRLTQRVPQIKQLVAQLRDEWPTSDGTLPAVGEYRVVPRRPNSPDALQLHAAFPFFEPFGSYIERRSSGIIHIDLDCSISNTRKRTTSHICVVEFLPEGSEPTDFTQAFEHITARYVLQGSERLADSVYLAWYDCILSHRTTISRSQKR